MRRKPQTKGKTTEENAVLRVIIELWDGRRYELPQHYIWNGLPIHILHNRHGGGIVFWDEKHMLKVAEGLEGVWTGKGFTSSLKMLFEHMLEEGMLKPVEEGYELSRST